MRLLVDALLSVLLAPACAACHHPLDSPSSSAVCELCWRSIRPLVAPFCTVCGDQLVSWRAEGRTNERCARCRTTQPSIAGGRTVGHYDGALREILHAFKYEGRRSLGTALGALMRSHGEVVLAGADFIVPVPLHWRRRWARGFNQAAVLAAAIGPVLHALRRRRHTPSQTGLSADERLANVRGAFRLRRCASPRIAHSCIVLVDDVSTTGATLEACARVLMAAGAREVRTLTAARVVTRPPGARPP